MSEYDSAIALATRLIAKKGKKVTWRRNAVVENSEEPWKPADSNAVISQPYICFVATTDKDWRKLLAYLKGSEVPTGRLAGLMARQSFEPKLKDTVIRKFNGADRTLSLINIDVLAPADEPILWILEFAEL